METKTIRRDSAACDLLHLPQIEEAWKQFARRPSADGGMADPNPIAEFGEGDLLLIEVIADMHDRKCTPNVNHAQDPCATVTADAVGGSGAPLRMHEHLRAWREANSLTLKDVANRVGTTHATVSRWENGVQAIPPHKFKQLAVVYGATPAELLVAPADREMALRFHRAAEIIGQLPATEVEQWLGLGRSLAEAQKKNVRET